MVLEKKFLLGNRVSVMTICKYICRAVNSYFQTDKMLALNTL